MLKTQDGDRRDPPRQVLWRLAGVLAGLSGMAFLAAVLVALVIGPMLLIGGGCGLYLGLHVQ